MIEPLDIQSQDERGTNFELADDYTLCRKAEGSVSGDHSDNVHEDIYLVSGTIEITIDEKTTTVSIPSHIYVEPQKYRKVTAVTDTLFLVKKRPV